MFFNVNEIKMDFPALNQLIKGKPPIYFDNACMSLKPKQVLEAMNEYYLYHPSCHKRSIHTFGKKTTARYKKARQTVADFINAKGEIIFTRNTTEGINLVANAFPFKEGDTILTTEMEHNSNLLPWQILNKRKGVNYIIFNLNNNYTFDLDKFEEELRQGIRLVSVFHTSHITGQSLPVESIIELSHKHGAYVLLDCAQSVVHQKIDVRRLEVDFLVFSFHKMLGPTGMGALYARREHLENMSQFLVGGETVEDVSYHSSTLSEIPDRFEAGLQNYAGAMGAEAAVNYLNDVGIKTIQQHELQLNSYITEELLKLPKIKILGPEDPSSRAGVINFFVEGLDSGELSILLDKTNNIMVRSGVHCSHAWYKKHELLPTVRISLSFYNTMEEAEIFVQTLEKIVKYF